MVAARAPPRRCANAASRPIDPGQKEGLALINGMAAGPAYAIYAYTTVRRCLDVANRVACASFEAHRGAKGRRWTSRCWRSRTSQASARDD